MPQQGGGADGGDPGGEADDGRPAGGRNDGMTGIVGIMNRAYATAEKALWNREVGRTTSEEAAGWIAAGRLAVAELSGRIVGAVCIEMRDEAAGWFGALSV